MKFAYDMTNNYKTIRDEVYGVIMNEKKLLKNENIKIKTVTQSNIITFLVIGIEIVILLVMNIYLKSEFIKIITIAIASIDIYFIIFSQLLFHKCLNLGNKKDVTEINENVIEINEDGIIAESGGNKFMISYDNIDLIVVTKNAIVFLDNFLNIFIPSKDKKIIIDKIKEYSKIKIIDKTNE